MSTSSTTTSTAGTSFTSASNTSGGVISTGNSFGACIHGTYGYCSLCTSGTLIGPLICSCNTINQGTCPVHSYTYPVTYPGTINVPSFTTWPPAPIPTDLCKDGHQITHREVVDAKGLKIEFTCLHCQEVIYKKYICRIPRKVREEKCLNRVLNPK